MQVRATATHFNKQYRVEGEVFEWNGPLHKYIEPVKAEPVKGKKQESKPAPVED